MTLMRVMAVDYGTRRVGVAVSDVEGRFARPVTTLDARDPGRLLDALARLAVELEPTEAVVGDPRRLDGSAGTLSAAIRDFCGTLGSRLGIPVHPWNESLTSVEAQAKLLEAGVSRRRRREAVDEAAAAVLLQAYLDSRPRRPA